MPYQIYISTNSSNACRNYLSVVKKALFNIRELPISVSDVATTTQPTLEQSSELITGADIFLGIYCKAEQDGDTQALIEAEYHLAVRHEKPILFFVPESARNSSDDRQAMFLQHVRERHIIHYFADDVELAAKVKLSIDQMKQSKSQQQSMQLRPPMLNFQPEKSNADADVFEELVNRAVSIAQDDIEQIVRRAIELHQAQQAVDKREPLKGVYVEDERDGLVLAQPIWGEPLRRSQFNADIFMIMPFRQKYNHIYENIIKPVVADLNLTMKRGDDFSSVQGAIMTEVFAAINACKLVIVETTEVNANVYYELGIAHTLGKPAILLTQVKEVDQLAFDIRHLRFLVYDDSIVGADKLKADLRKSIIWTLNDLEEQQDS